MALSIAQLLTPVSKAEAIQWLIDQLGAVGFNASSWQSGSIRRTMLEAFATGGSDLTIAVRIMTEAGFNALASGALLTDFSKSRYDNTRIAAVRTRGPLRLTTAAGSGPYTITIGQLVVKDATNGYTYRNVTGGTLTGGTTNDTIIFEAEVAGSSRNVGTNTITVLATPLAGVTVSNPVITGSTWYTTAGADEESDAALRTRNITKWALFSLGRPADAYRNMALGVAGVTRVGVDQTNSRGTGFTDCYLAGPTATASAQNVTDVQALYTLYEAAGATTTAFAATEKTINIVGQIFIEASKNTAAGREAVRQRLRDYINGLDIRGVILPPATTGVVPKSELIGAVTSAPGVKSFPMTSPNSDTPLLVNEVAVVGSLPADNDFVSV